MWWLADFQLFRLILYSVHETQIFQTNLILAAAARDRSRHHIQIADLVKMVLLVADSKGLKKLKAK